jgi:hypothetical protein
LHGAFEQAFPAITAIGLVLNGRKQIEQFWIAAPIVQLGAPRIIGFAEAPGDSGAPPLLRGCQLIPVSCEHLRVKISARRKIRGVSHNLLNPLSRFVTPPALPGSPCHAETRVRVVR